jgi:hypothetical protein
MKIRIENIECRFIHDTYEFVKWYPNSYYGAEAKLEKEGYKRISSEDGKFSLAKDHHYIDSSCFKNPEGCYVIAIITYDDNENCTEIRSVGDRLLKLTGEERMYFFEVYHYADRQIKKEKLNKEEE